ncbi:MAG: DUF805 domain-containing protein [Elusimicrobiales bacterium]
MSPKDIFFSFQGRINRKTFLVYGVAASAGFLVSLGCVFGFAAAVPILAFPFLIACFISLHSIAALQVKRYHDIGWKGWAAFIPVLVFPLFIVALVFLGAVAGTPGPNQYGDPQDPGVSGQ